MSRPKSLTCVIPCLNEEANLNVLLPGLMTVLKSLVPAYEIIVVDDGSTDATPQSMQRWTREHPQIIYMQLSRNFGKEAAMSAGLEAAQGQVVVCMDADLQHPPALIPRMLERWEQGVEMVYAVRATRQDESLFKRLGTRLFYKLMRSPGGLQVPENAGDFRLMDRAVVDALLLLPERNRFMKGLFAWVGFKSEPILYSPPERLYGKTCFRPLKLFRLAVDGLTAFTTWPLRLVSISGMLLSMLSFLYGLFIVITHLLYGDPVQGFTTLITVVLFFAGINLVSLGVVGEYVGRIFDEVKNRPVYLVRRQEGKGLDADRPHSEKLSLVVSEGHDTKPSRASSRSAAL
jgi:glycosyltransferase involved in cell wall biosynthesis